MSVHGTKILLSKFAWDYLICMTLHAENNPFSTFRLGFFNDAIAPSGFDAMEDDVGNVLEDDSGNKLISPE